MSLLVAVKDERRVLVSDLVGSREIADRLGYAHAESIHKLRQSHDDFPSRSPACRSA